MTTTTALTDLLTARIRAEGPITIADYMADCLLHPGHGYYATRDPFGAKGDFITAPEISQMFGELIGLALAQAWIAQGRPRPFTLAEPGPGRGTLMADLLRATRGVAGFHDAAQVTLIEASPVLRKAQRARLADHAPRWIESAAQLPEAPLFLIANEFFDALPLRQFQRETTGWAERRVALEHDRLALALSAPAEVPALAHRLADTRPGDVVELCPAAVPIMAEIAGRIAKHGGAALIVDYGDWRSLGDTLQALRAHQPVGILDCPGDADLTAHVDFEPLAQTARRAGAHTAPLVGQGLFLERLGITARAQALARNLSGGALDELVAAHRRLTHPEEMGTLFKVLGLFPGSASPPPGLEQ
ncbi:class I SAM-dependent methyltransferase [Pontibaca methylaminivorans]|uniref:SAM-dependent methyltransferase, MidA family n=1 Tax=Pontibaca methylaminivorans TaxID=515897 RepID=A0A1R3WWE2_9RHOB|nr:SAM-dependent methyltransferase [Pontibaca methylaminivorans]SIT81760.1 SAM-dependent methyltransferase, MidA family [Pontibaca methylaminivorans]